MVFYFMCEKCKFYSTISLLQLTYQAILSIAKKKNMKGNTTKTNNEQKTEPASVSLKASSLFSA